jgi:hypothetical protein
MRALWKKRCGGFNCDEDEHTDKSEQSPENKY